MSDNENKLHSAMAARDAIEGAGKGLAVGALAGAASKASKSRAHAGHGAALGGLVGLAAGALKGKERILRDVVRESRNDSRWTNRRMARLAERRPDLAKKTAASFVDELEKLGFMTALATQIGQKAIGLGARGAKAVGQGQRFGQAMKTVAASPVGGKNLARNMGYGVMGAGALGAGHMLAGGRDR